MREQNPEKRLGGSICVYPWSREGESPSLYAVEFEWDGAYDNYVQAEFAASPYLPEAVDRSPLVVPLHELRQVLGESYGERVVNAVLTEEAQPLWGEGTEGGPTMGWCVERSLGPIYGVQAREMEVAA